jgi:hypothetical protein
MQVSAKKDVSDNQKNMGHPDNPTASGPYLLLGMHSVQAGRSGGVNVLRQHVVDAGLPGEGREAAPAFHSIVVRYQHALQGGREVHYNLMPTQHI